MTYDASKIPSIIEITNSNEKALTIKLLPNGVIAVEKDSTVKYRANSSEELLQIILAVKDSEGISYEVKDVTSVTPTPTPSDPEITLLDFDIASGLQEGNANVDSGAIVVTLSTNGGTSPFTYSFNEDSEAGKDNGLFTIDGDKIKVGTNALTTGNYKISVKVTDKNSKTFINTTVITVAEAAKVDEQPSGEEDTTE